MEKFLCSLVILFCSLFLIKINRSYKKKCINVLCLQNTDSHFFRFLFDLILYTYLANYLLPSILHIVFNYEVILDENVQPLELAVVFLVETFSWIVFYVTFYNRCKNTRHNLGFTTKANNATDIICIIIFLIYIFVSFTNYSHNDDEPSIWEQRFFFIIPFVQLVGYFLAIFVIFSDKNLFAKKVRILAFVSLFAYLIWAILSGIRGNIANVIMWTAYVIYLFKDKNVRRKYYCILSGILLLFVLSQQLFMGFRAVDKNDSLSEQIMSAVRLSNNSYLYKNDRYNLENILHEADYRFGAQSTYSVGFYRLVDKEGHVGLNCILNSFYSFIPSAIYGSKKPISTSSDGTKEGMGMFKCQNAINGSSSMSGFFSSAHAYWELGMIGVLLFSIIPALYIFFCIKLFRKLDFIGLPLFTAVVAKSWLNAKMWVSLIVLEYAQIILPVILLIILYRFFNRPLKSSRIRY